ERARQRALDARERLERDAASERRAVAAAARFATRLLDEVAGPALEERLVDLALAELPALPAERRAAIRAALEAPATQLQVVTAYALAPPRRAALAAALGAITGRALAPEFRVDPALKAGVSIRAGAWVLMANLRDELEFFSVNLDHGE
ncbi:MAG: F0F1 ATP synthase subunit delta, partial [Burkholderiales bacterium]|nr:F0F1 ATP synthase subunit delta [Burkholderiales bacterium]